MFEGVFGSGGVVDILTRGVCDANRMLTSWQALDEKMPEVDRAFHKVRCELAEVGLLDEDVYLDQIDLYVALLPSRDEVGYVYEDSSIVWLLGFEEGVIYLPIDLPQMAYVPGGTLTDTIRHEFAHAWHWLEPEFFEREWFEQAFTTAYDDCSPVAFTNWDLKLDRNKKFIQAYDRLRSDNTRERFYMKHLLNEFATPYAATMAREDFAETFMIYLRCRNSLDRFKSRKGFYKKLKAVEKAVRVARKELGL